MSVLLLTSLETSIPSTLTLANTLVSTLGPSTGSLIPSEVLVHVVVGLQVCMLGSSAIATESLKNLVLPGIDAA